MSGAPRLKRARFEDTSVGVEGEVSDDEDDGEDEYEQGGIDDGSQPNDTFDSHRAADNRSAQGPPASPAPSAEASDVSEGDELFEEVWGFSCANLLESGFDRLALDADATQQTFLQVHYGLHRWAEGQQQSHAYAVAMLLDCCGQKAGFYDARVLDAVRERFNVFRQRLEPACPGPFVNDEGDEVRWDDFTDKATQVVDILQEMSTLPTTRSERVEGDLGQNQAIAQLLIKHMTKHDLFVSVGDLTMWRKIHGNAKFAQHVTGQDDAIGRGVHCFGTFLTRLRASTSVKVKQHNPDLYDLTALLSKNLSDHFINDFTRAFLTSDNSRVLRKRVNFIRFADFGLDQNTMRVYAEGEIGMTWLPFWTYLDTRFCDIAYPLDTLRDLDNFVPRYEIEDTIGNWSGQAKADRRAIRLRYRKEQHADRLKAAEDFPDDLVVRCDAAGVPVPQHDDGTPWVIWAPGSRHLLRLFEDQGWPAFGVHMRMVLLGRNFFWHFVGADEIQNWHGEELDHSGPRMGTGGEGNVAGPAVGEGGEHAHAVSVDFGKSGSGKSTIVTFLKKANGELCKGIRSEGNNAEFFASQVGRGAVLNLVMDELSINSDFPVHDFLQMTSGQTAHANVKNEQKLATIHWIYSMTLMCNDGQFPRSLSDDLVRLKRRIMPFNYGKSFSNNSDETLTGKIEKNVAHIHLEVLMHRKQYILDCGRLGFDSPNYTKYIAARDTTTFMHACRIQFFCGLNESPYMDVFRKNKFEYNPDCYSLLDNVRKATHDAFVLYRRELLKFIQTQYSDTIEEHDGTDTDKHDSALRLLKRKGIDFKDGKRPCGWSDIDKVSMDCIAFGVVPLPEYMQSATDAQDKWAQAASIFFSENVHAVHTIKEWPPGSGITLEANYLVGCAPRAKHYMYCAPRGVSSHQVRVIVACVGQPTDVWRIECRLTEAVHGWLQSWCQKADSFDRLQYADFENHTRGMTRHLAASEDWSPEFANTTRHTVILS